MATVTKEQVLESALARLGVASPGQPISADDFSHCLEALHATLELLDSEGLVVPITDSGGDEKNDTLDRKYLLPLRDLVAFHAAPSFYSAPQDIKLYEFGMALIRSQLEDQTDFAPVEFTDY